jgi:hypothetical protein
VKSRESLEAEPWYAHLCFLLSCFQAVNYLWWEFWVLISNSMYFCQSGFDVKCAIHPEHHLWSVWGNQPRGLAGLDPVWGDAGQVNKSLLWIRIWIRIRIHFRRLDPNPHWEYGSGSRRVRIKMTHKMKKIHVLDVIFWGMKTSPVARTSFMEA